jgi:hypothetical protein
VTVVKRRQDPATENPTQVISDLPRLVDPTGSAPTAW